MGAPILASQRAHRILRRLRCFQPAAELPSELASAADDSVIGAIEDRAYLTERGVYLPIGASWLFTAYEDVVVSFPAKSNRTAPLVLRTPSGIAPLLPGNGELWSVGRFFMRCREDKRAA